MNQKKTIWIINQYASTPSSGMGGRHYYLAKYLAKKGHKVYLIASSYSHLLKNPPQIKDNICMEKIEGFHFVWIKMSSYSHAHSKKRVLNWFLFPIKLLSLKKYIKDRPDSVVVSSPSLFSFLGAKYLASLHKAKLVFEVRDIWPLTLIEIGGYSPKHPFIKLMQYVEDKAYKYSDKVISNLPYAYEHMIKRGMPKEKFAWIPNGIDVEEMQEQEDLSESVKNQIPKNKFIIGYTGSIGVANALDILIEAAILLKDNLNISFVIVGKGKDKGSLIQKVQQHDLQNVIFIDSIPKQQIQTMLKSFDVCFLGLKKSDIFRFGVSPNKLFDYFFSKKPVLYSIDSGKYTPVLASKSGIEVESENIENLVSAILKLHKLSEEEILTMGENARNFVLSNHD